MQAQFFQALLESICKRTGLPMVIPHDECAEWVLGSKRLFIRLGYPSNELRVEGFGAAPGLPIYGTCSPTDLDQVCFVVNKVAEQLLAAE